MKKINELKTLLGEKEKLDIYIDVNEMHRELFKSTNDRININFI